MFLALVMACSLYVEDDCKVFKDTRGFHMTEESCVKRVFGSVRAIVNLVMRVHGIEGSNAFSGTFMPDRGDASTRQPIPTDKLKVIQQRCQTTDDEPR